MPEQPDRLPQHRRIALAIERSIAEGELATGSRLPAEPALARQFGVSRGTLRQALRTLRERGLVDAVPGRGNYVVHGTPSRPEARRKVVGVVVPSVAERHVPDLLTWIEDELHVLGYSMLVGSSGSTREQQAGRIHRILEEGASGIIAYPIDYDPDPILFGHLADRAFPVVLIDRHLLGVAVDAVLPDNVGGAYAAIAHLAERGRRRIGFVSSDNLGTSSVAERLSGYQQAVAAYELDDDPALVFARLPISRRWPSQASGSERNAELLEAYLRSQRPDAVFTLHDELAADVLVAAVQLSLSVPEQLAIVTFDDEPIAARLRVPLTAIAQPREEMGRTAARLIVDRIEGRRGATARIVLPTELIVRRSSGAAQPAAKVAT